MAKAGQLKWVMKLDISWPRAVSTFRASWSLPTVATDRTCPQHTGGAHELHAHDCIYGLGIGKGFMKRWLAIYFMGPCINSFT